MKIFQRFKKPKTAFTEEMLLKLLEETKHNLPLIDSKLGTLAFTKPFKVDCFFTYLHDLPDARLDPSETNKEEWHFGSDENLSTWLFGTYLEMIQINPKIDKLNKLTYDKFVNEGGQDFKEWIELSQAIRDHLPMVRHLIKVKLYHINEEKYPIDEATPGCVQIVPHRLAQVHQLDPILGEDGQDFVEGIIRRANSIESCKLYDAKGFEVVVDYFNEARRCFVTGNYRASVIMSIASLEGCLYEDYYRRNGKKFKKDKKYNSIFTLYLDQQLISSAYTSVVDTHKRMRNNIVHHNNSTTTFTEQSARKNLEGVKDVINSILVRYVQ